MLLFLVLQKAVAMKVIRLDKRKKALLLKWLQEGEICCLEYSQLARETTMTIQELDEETNRFILKCNEDLCRRIRRLRKCPLE